MREDLMAEFVYHAAFVLLGFVLTHAGLALARRRRGCYGILVARHGPYGDWRIEGRVRVLAETARHVRIRDRWWRRATWILRDGPTARVLPIRMAGADVGAGPPRSRGGPFV